MSERLKTILALASLGLFLLAAVACVRSFLPPTLRFYSHKGKLLVVCMSVDEATFKSFAERYTGGEDDVMRDIAAFAYFHRGFLGFGYASGTTDVSFRVFSVPYWFILGATAAFPAAWWRRRRRTRVRSDAGQCPGCGYDLRGTPERCPECGWSKPAPSPTPAS